MSDGLRQLCPPFQSRVEVHPLRSFDEELGILGQDATSVDNNVSEEFTASIFRGSVV